MVIIESDKINPFNCTFTALRGGFRDGDILRTPVVDRHLNFKFSQHLNNINNTETNVSFKFESFSRPSCLSFRNIDA